jgi:hypothetical protein
LFRRSVVATGDGAGKVKIWKLNEELMKVGNKESESLSSMAASALQ